MAVVDWRRGVGVLLVVVMVGVRVLVTDRLQVLPNVGFDLGICLGEERRNHALVMILDLNKLAYQPCKFVESARKKPLFTGRVSIVRNRFRRSFSQSYEYFSRNWRSKLVASSFVTL